MKSLPLIFSGVIIGIILFQSILVAPAVNKIINTQDASIFLRYIWPKFFLIIAIISFGALIINIIYSNPNIFKILTLISFLLMLICFFLTPVINNAKDTLNDQLWSVLHLLTIILTLITLILNVLIVVFWKATN